MAGRPGSVSGVDPRSLFSPARLPATCASIRQRGDQRLRSPVQRQTILARFDGAKSQSIVCRRSANNSITAFDSPLAPNCVRRAASISQARGRSRPGMPLAQRPECSCRVIIVSPSSRVALAARHLLKAISRGSELGRTHRPWWPTGKVDNSARWRQVSRPSIEPRPTAGRRHIGAHWVSRGRGCAFRARVRCVWPRRAAANQRPP